MIIEQARVEKVGCIESNHSQSEGGCLNKKELTRQGDGGELPSYERWKDRRMV